MENWLTISVYAIIEKDNHVLLTEDEEKPGWKLPGGLVEKSELLLEGLLREVKEETGLDIEPTGLVTIQNYVKSGGRTRVRIYFTASLVGGDIKRMPGEVKRIEWVSKERLKDLVEEDFFIEVYFLAVQEYLAGRVYPIAVVKEL